MKEFWLTVLAGVVALAIYRTLDNATPTSRLLGPTVAGGEQTGINRYIPIGVQAGHGDAVGNVGGTPDSISCLVYHPAFGGDENNCGNSMWFGVGLSR